MIKHEFISKSVFFPEQGILAVGDLHLGYEEMFRIKGYSIPKQQIIDTIEDLDKIIKEIEKENKKLKKVVFMGDLKHFFSFQRSEGTDLLDIYEFLSNKISEENIILIKGNHDTFELIGRKMHDYWIEDKICFTHGNKLFPEIFGKEVKIIVMSHIHPSVTLHDSQRIKKESYKCFLVGKWNKKEVIIVPSFLRAVEGSDLISGSYDEDFFVVPEKVVNKFDVYVIGEKILNFGKLKKLISSQD